MPKINVYLPDALADAVKSAGLPVSAVCQAALERAVREVTALRAVASRQHLDTQDWAAGTRVAFERYTTRAREAVSLARRAAVEHGHSHVDTEHLLFGILDQADNLAVKILTALDVEPEDLRAEVSAYVSDGESNDQSPALSTSLRVVFELAVAESSKLGHNYIGCEHLLIGLVDEPDGVAGSVLRQLGLDARSVRRAVTSALAGFVHYHDTVPDTSQDITHQMSEVLRRLNALEVRVAGG